MGEEWEDRKKEGPEGERQEEGRGGKGWAWRGRLRGRGRPCALWLTAFLLSTRSELSQEVKVSEKEKCELPKRRFMRA